MIPVLHFFQNIFVLLNTLAKSIFVIDLLGYGIVSVNWRYPVSRRQASKHPITEIHCKNKMYEMTVCNLSHLARRFVYQIGEWVHGPIVVICDI